MNLLNEKYLKNKGFTELQNGMMVLIDVFKDEITDIVVAYRIRNLQNEPLSGFMLSGLQFTEYVEDTNRLDKLLGL